MPDLIAAAVAVETAPAVVEGARHLVATGGVYANQTIACHLTHAASAVASARHIEAINLAEVLDLGPPWLSVAAAPRYFPDAEVLENECRRCEVRWVASLGDTCCWICGGVDSTNVRRLDVKGTMSHV